MTDINYPSQTAEYDQLLADFGLALNPAEHKAYRHACRCLAGVVGGPHALAATLAEARNVFGVLMVLQSTAEGGMGHHQPATWPRVGRAIVEMLASGRAFSALALQRYLEKIPVEDTVADPPSLRDHARRWVALIFRYRFSELEDGEAAMAAFDQAVRAGEFADATLALRVLQEVNPTNSLYRAGGDAETCTASVAAVLRRDTALLGALPPQET